jgi:hypothetical protein
MVSRADSESLALIRAALLKDSVSSGEVRQCLAPDVVRLDLEEVVKLT